MKFDPETVIADFLGDLHDGHPRVGKLNSTDYAERLRPLARELIEDFKANGITLKPAATDQGKRIVPRHRARVIE